MDEESRDQTPMLGSWLIAFALSHVGAHRQAATVVSFDITGWVLVSYLGSHEEFPQVIAGLWNVGRGLPNLFFCRVSTVSSHKCIAQNGDVGEHVARVPCARSSLTMQMEEAEKRRRQAARTGSLRAQPSHTTMINKRLLSPHGPLSRLQKNFKKACSYRNLHHRISMQLRIK